MLTPAMTGKPGEIPWQMLWRYSFFPLQNFFLEWPSFSVKKGKREIRLGREDDRLLENFQIIYEEWWRNNVIFYWLY